jgi:hypothetical protein
MGRRMIVVAFKVIESLDHTVSVTRICYAILTMSPATAESVSE